MRYSLRIFLLVFLFAASSIADKLCAYNAAQLVDAFHNARIDWSNGKGITPTQVEDIAQKMLAASQVDPTTIRYVMKHGWNNALARLEKQAAEKKALTAALLKLAEEQRWLTEPRGLQRFVAWKRSHEKAMQGILTTLGMSGLFFGVPPLHFPRLGAATAGTQMKWNTPGRIYDWASWLFVIGTTLSKVNSDHAAQELAAQQALEDFEAAVNNTSAVSEEQSIEQIMMAQWALKFEEKHGHPPDPNSPEYIQAKEIFGVQ